MPLGIELEPDFDQSKEPHRDPLGRLIYDHAREMSYLSAKRDWDRINSAMNSQFSRENCQVVILGSKNDIAISLHESLQNNPLGAYPATTTIDQQFPDKEPRIKIRNEAVDAESVYIVASILSAGDYRVVRSIAYHYREILNAKCVTLVSPFLAFTRQDKNIDRDGKYVAEPLSIAAEMASSSGLIDRIIAVEPHSGSTQAFAADSDIALVPVSPWQLIIDELVKRQAVDLKNAVVIGPDKGRNLAATRIAQYLGLEYVSFNKDRLSGQKVTYYTLTEDEKELIRQRNAIGFDDEVSTAGTLGELGQQLEGLASSFLVGVTHIKLTSEWVHNLRHPFPNKILGTDSRKSIGDPGFSSGKIEVMSLGPWIRGLIDADIKGINFWTDPAFSGMVLQPNDKD